MLYCPKCQHEYEENGQRFCVNDNSRLVPVGTSPKSVNQSGGVFSTILSDVLSFERTEGIAARNREFVRPAVRKQELSQTPERDFDTTEDENRSEPLIDVPINKPFSRVINPSEIPSGQADLGDRETRPAGRSALSRENPQILIGQTVKGRYRVVEKFRQNESSITYLAEDQLAAGKKVFVCVLMEDAAGEAERNFYDERVSLSHINHPNINRLIDSGSLLEGKSFIISEFVEGTSLKEMLAQNREFDLMRTARVVRQIGNALSAALQNGILHGNLSPDDVILSINKAGTEQVKVINFSTSTGGATGSFAYKSPEQLEGKTVGFASDIYSLGVIAYQMLTGRLPFNASTPDEHLRLRREGMTFRPTSFRLDVPFAIDDILKKALAYKPSERFSKAKDFGDAFYNALTAVAAPEETAAEKKIESFISANDLFADKEDDLLSFSELFEVKPETESKTELKAKDSPDNEEVQIPPPIPIPSTPIKERTDKSEAVEKAEEAKAPEELAWQKRSIEPVKSGGHNLMAGAAVGIVLLCVGLWAVWAYFLNRPNEPQFAPVQTAVQTETPVGSEIPQTPVAEQQNPVISSETELPPNEPRKIEAPPNSVYFENSRENTSKELLKNYRGFSLYYPNNWKRNKAESKFIDVSMEAPNGVPIEQMMISPYVSKGTFSKDKEEFPKLVEKSNKDLAAALSGNYKVVSEGETTIQNGRWKAYEVKFQASGEVDGKEITIWGRRLWIPVQRPGAGSGFIVTMLASSYSNDIKTVDDVGVKGKLAEILYTFEPDTNF